MQADGGALPSIAGKMGRPLSAAAVLILTLSSSPAGCGSEREAVRDVWSLWLEYEPSCLDPRERSKLELSSQERWHRALTALTEETLTVMEGRLAKVSPPRGETVRRLEDLLAASRRLCELTGPALPEAIPGAASMIVEARAEVAAARSRLSSRLGIENDEVHSRTRLYAGRLSEAVTRALATAAADPHQRPPAPAEVAVPLPPPERAKGASGQGALHRDAAEKGTSEGTKPPGSPRVGAGEGSAVRMRIESTAGLPWIDIRRRRELETARRLARWRPLYDEGLRSLAETRMELARGLRGESLEGLRDLCSRLAGEVSEVPTEVTEEAPRSSIGSDLQRMLGRYSAAGRACSEDRYEEAWTHLLAADRSWGEVTLALERLDTGLFVPPSLLEDGVGGN